jgi:hypothetical protein
MGLSMAESILEQIQLIQELIKTDQQTVDAIHARLALILSLLNTVAEQIELQEGAPRTAKT